MSAGSVNKRGRPLAMLGLVLAVWITGRAMLWESPFAAQELLSDAGQVLFAESDVPKPSAIDKTETMPSASVLATVDGRRALLPPAFRQPLTQSPLPILYQPVEFANQPTADAVVASNQSAAVGHQLLWMAAMAHMPVPDQLAQHMTRAPTPTSLQPGATKRADHWSLDAWVFWREGSSGALVSQGRVPSYGASQAGAVLRYPLATESDHAPNAYLRAYRALISGGESEIAAGVSARPLPVLPLRAHAELRGTRVAGETRAPPSAFVTTEFPTIALPLGLNAEAYAQAGYVGGKGKTAFADGQLHVMRAVKDFDLGRLSVGGAAWGGAQKGSRRVDLGPSMRLDLTIGETPARLSVDWRERVAGNAEPDSGVAVTLSTRF